ncbi:hypothetical protein BDW66DRAFT_44304 [Aspergillus desertorum]
MPVFGLECTECQRPVHTCMATNMNPNNQHSMSTSMRLMSLPPLHSHAPTKHSLPRRTASQTPYNLSRLHLHLHSCEYRKSASTRRSSLGYLSSGFSPIRPLRNWALTPRVRAMASQAYSVSGFAIFHAAPSTRPAAEYGVAQLPSPTSYPTSRSVEMRLDLVSRWDV